MPRAIWTGFISFGLVSIPVKLLTATRDKDIHFHMVDEKSKCRVRQKLYCPGEKDDIQREDVVKGYEISPDQHVFIRKEELETLAPEESRTIDIQEFVELSSIDPIFYDKPYYLLPEKRAEKPYTLLLRAMKESSKVGVARFVMRGKGYIAAVRPVDNVLCLETMRFADEVVEASTLDGLPEKMEVNEKELKMALQLINALAEEFDPKKYHDEYREKIQELIDRKAQGEEIAVQTPEPETRGRVINLMAALEQSLDRATKRKTEGKKGPQKKSRRKAS
jgi:DNA end-binding protein Ku